VREAHVRVTRTYRYTRIKQSRRKWIWKAYALLLCGICRYVGLLCRRYTYVSHIPTSHTYLCVTHTNEQHTYHIQPTKLDMESIYAPLLRNMRICRALLREAHVCVTHTHEAHTLQPQPTNHLDLESIEWMEDFLINQKIPMVIVSHDREFLDRVCTKTVDCDMGVTYRYCTCVAVCCRVLQCVRPGQLTWVGSTATTSNLLNFNSSNFSSRKRSVFESCDVRHVMNTSQRMFYIYI